MRFLACSIVLLLAVSPAFGQGQSSALSRGFDATAPAIATAEELAPGDLWVMQVDFKPMRLIEIETRDPQTGEKRTDTIWYVMYRAMNKPLKTPAKDEDKTPVNNYDAPPGPPLLIPEFELVSDDNNVQRVYRDVVIPEAVAAIARREMRGTDQQNQLKNSVEIVQPVPAASERPQPIYGVATFRGVDPTTDNFKVYASGFSNGYRQIKGPDGKPVILRREIAIDYWRPGDEFDLTEREFRFRTQPRWIYRADEAEPTDAGEDALRSASAEAR